MMRKLKKKESSRSSFSPQIVLYNDNYLPPQTFKYYSGGDEDNAHDEVITEESVIKYLNDILALYDKEEPSSPYYSETFFFEKNTVVQSPTKELDDSKVYQQTKQLPSNGKCPESFAQTPANEDGKCFNQIEKLPSNGKISDGKFPNNVVQSPTNDKTDVNKVYEVFYSNDDSGRKKSSSSVRSDNLCARTLERYQFLEREYGSEKINDKTRSLENHRKADEVLKSLNTTNNPVREIINIETDIQNKVVKKQKENSPTNSFSANSSNNVDKTSFSNILNNRDKKTGKTNSPVFTATILGNTSDKTSHSKASLNNGDKKSGKTSSPIFTATLLEKTSDKTSHSKGSLNNGDKKTGKTSSPIFTATLLEKNSDKNSLNNNNLNNQDKKTGKTSSPVFTATLQEKETGKTSSPVFTATLQEKETGKTILTRQDTNTKQKNYSTSQKNSDTVRLSKQKSSYTPRHLNDEYQVSLSKTTDRTRTNSIIIKKGQTKIVCSVETS